MTEDVLSKQRNGKQKIVSVNNILFDKETDMSV